MIKRRDSASDKPLFTRDRSSPQKQIVSKPQTRHEFRKMIGLSDLPDQVIEQKLEGDRKRAENSPIAHHTQSLSFIRKPGLPPSKRSRISNTRNMSQAHSTSNLGKRKGSHVSNSMAQLLPESPGLEKKQFMNNDPSQPQFVFDEEASVAETDLDSLLPPRFASTISKTKKKKQVPPAPRDMHHDETIKTRKKELLKVQIKQKKERLRSEKLVKEKEKKVREDKLKAFNDKIKKKNDDYKRKVQAEKEVGELKAYLDKERSSRNEKPQLIAARSNKESKSHADKRYGYKPQFKTSTNSFKASFQTQKSKPVGDRHPQHKKNPFTKKRSSKPAVTITSKRKQLNIKLPGPQFVENPKSSVMSKRSKKKGKSRQSGMTSSEVSSYSNSFMGSPHCIDLNLDESSIQDESQPEVQVVFSRPERRVESKEEK